MQTRQQASAVPTALILVPEKWNYFYHQHGRRLTEALTELGFEAEIATLTTCPDRTYDWCVITSVTEVIFDHTHPGPAEQSVYFTPERERAAVGILRNLARKWKAVAACSLDCLGTRWFRELKERCDAIGIKTLLDFGLFGQAKSMPSDSRASYHFIFNGLTTSEALALEEGFADEQRTIPWAFVGHATPNRVTLVDRLVQEIDPGGFVYLPRIGPIFEKNSPHLNQAQYETVLRHTRYQIWCTHHDVFYMESERFRMSLLGGSVPLKVVPSRRKCPPGIPFDFLLVEEDELARFLLQCSFPLLRRRFLEEFRSRPSLKDSLGEYLARAGIVRPSADGEPARMPRKAAG